MKRIIFTPIGGKIILFSLVAMMVAACSKSDVPSPPPAPDAPVFTSFSVSDDTVFFKESVTINWVVSNATKVTVNAQSPNKQPTDQFESGPLVEHKTYTIKATGPGGTTVKTVSVFVHPENVTFMTKYKNGWRKPIEVKSRRVGTTEWFYANPEALYCNQEQFLPTLDTDGKYKGKTVLGACAGESEGLIVNFRWELTSDNIFASGQNLALAQHWRLTYLDSAKFVRELRVPVFGTSDSADVVETWVAY